ncbi:hypothetical protein D9M72_204220 [compost metagenome]
MLCRVDEEHFHPVLDRTDEAGDPAVGTPQAGQAHRVQVGIAHQGPEELDVILAEEMVRGAHGVFPDVGQALAIGGGEGGQGFDCREHPCHQWCVALFQR